MFTIETRKLIRGSAEHEAAGLGKAADYVAINEDIASPIDGTISRIYTGQEGGNWIWILDAQERTWKMAHLSKYKSKQNDKVKKNQIIAVSGNTGSITTNPHLHLEVWKNGQRLDPEIIIKELLSNNNDMTIVRNQKTGEFSYIQDGKRRKITQERAGLAMITVWTKGFLAKDEYQNLSETDYLKIPQGTDF